MVPSRLNEAVPSNVTTSRVSPSVSTIVWSGPALATGGVFVDGSNGSTVMTTVSDAVAPEPSVTVSTMVWDPTTSGTWGATPAAIWAPPSNHT